MYDATIELLLDGKMARYQVFSGGRQLAFIEALELLQKDSDFRTFMTDQLKQSVFSAFRWETPPLQTTNRSREFEFVLIDSPSFTKRATDAATFKSYFAAADDESGIVSFTNLGGDATLIVPSPRTKEDVYGHFASFLRKAPVLQVDALWQKIGSTVVGMISDSPIWLSTAGGGVAWLHVRLDSTPKYYGYAPYRRFA